MYRIVGVRQNLFGHSLLVRGSQSAKTTIEE